MVRSMFFWKYFKNDAAITYICLIYKEITEHIVCLTARAVGLLKFFPVKYIGIGEGMDDLQIFRRSEFVNSLFGE